MQERWALATVWLCGFAFSGCTGDSGGSSGSTASSGVTPARQSTCSTSNCHAGAEDMHPGFALTCVECHGGDDTAGNKTDSHVLRPSTFGEFPLGAGTHTGNDTLLRGPRVVRDGDPNNDDHSDAALLAYRQFINPGDLLVAQRTCGKDFSRDATQCHGETTDRVIRSLHATGGGVFSGTYQINGFRNRFGTEHGDERDKAAFVAAVLPGGKSIVDPDFDPSIRGTVRSIDHEIPRDDVSARNPNAPHNADVATNDAMFATLTSFLQTDCTRCHLYSEGRKQPGEFRSSGCSACHVYYANDGRSISADASISKTETDHPYRHTLQRFPSDEQCTHCHNRGQRHGLAAQGMRERPQGFLGDLFDEHGENTRTNDADVAGGRTGGFFPSLPRFFLSKDAAGRLIPAALGDFLFGEEWDEETLFGRDTGRTDGNNFLIQDEDTSNTYDETPHDFHTALGIQCVDCHTREEMHGDGHIYSDRFAAREVKCETCHGSPVQRADDYRYRTTKNRVLHQTSPMPTTRGLSKAANGQINLTLAPLQGRPDPAVAVAPDVRKVKQIKDVVTPSHPDYNQNAVDGCQQHSVPYAVPGQPVGRLECYTCHSTWSNTCFSCHMMIDYGSQANGDTNGDGIIDSPPGSITSFLDNTARFGSQDQQRWVTTHDHLVLGINADGRIAPFGLGGTPLWAVSADGAKQGGRYDAANFVADPKGGKTVSNFVFTVRDGGQQLPSLPLNPIVPHTTQAKPRNCNSCHPDSSLTGVARTSQLELVDKAIGIGNGLRRAGGVADSPLRISTARVQDDPVNGTGVHIERPFDTGPLSSLTLRSRDVKIGRTVRIFTGDHNATTDFTDLLTGAAVQDGDEVSINWDEFIRVTPNLTTLDNNGLRNFQVNSITRVKPSTRLGAKPLDGIAIRKCITNLVVNQPRDSK
jgi:hypothetical protein